MLTLYPFKPRKISRFVGPAMSWLVEATTTGTTLQKLAGSSVLVFLKEIRRRLDSDSFSESVPMDVGCGTTISSSPR